MKSAIVGILLSIAPAWAGGLTPVTHADFDREVVEASFEQLVLVDFWTRGCPPCVLAERQLLRLEGAKLVGVDIESEFKFGIGVVPTVQAWRNGSKVGQFRGLKSDGDLEAWVAARR